MVMVIAPRGGSRVAESADDNGTPPILHIEYHTERGAGPLPPSICRSAPAVTIWKKTEAAAG